MKCDVEYERYVLIVRKTIKISFFPIQLFLTYLQLIAHNQIDQHPVGLLK